MQIHDRTAELLAANARLAAEITERQQIEIELRKSDERYRVLVETLPDVIYEFDAVTGNITFLNLEFERVTGWSRSEWIGKPFMNLLHPDDLPRAQAAFLKNCRGKTPGRNEFRILCKPGHYATGEFTSIPQIHNGKVVGELGIARDITERKQMEEHLLRNQRLESIGSLAGGIAHDLNNILGPIIMSASMLGEDLPKQTSQELVVIIREAAQRGADIVNQVLTFARGAKGEHEILQPCLLIDQVKRFLQEALPKTVAFKVSLSEGLWNIAGNMTQLHQVLVNLCVNARDAMPEGGDLSLSAKNFVVCEQFAAKVPEAKAGRYVRINITDTGTGIPREILQKIFDPFFTTKAQGKGTGLGLSTVLGIVKSHGGFVTIDSKIRKGSKFSVYFPATAESQAPSVFRTQAPTPRGKGELILVVDDEISICKMAKTILTKTGYKILTAAHGKEALELLKQHGSAIKAVLTDLAMPVMDGVALTRALKATHPSLPIIASTGLAAELRYKELRCLNVQSFLSKPYSAQQLLAVVHHALSGTPKRAR
ncbi:MAG: PAS domain S-box protein [Verrucomicrobia bacterium]|nr:PAS domain S-box protein [Verrucomicrobiota bacterium]